MRWEIYSGRVLLGAVRAFDSAEAIRIAAARWGVVAACLRAKLAKEA